MEKSVRVKILGREYGLRVQEDDEQLTQEIAEYLDSKMRMFRDAHPEQQDVTTAVIAGLAVTEELFTQNNRLSSDFEDFERQLDELSDRLDTVLSPGQ
jgi:cell division protein ZapA